MKKLFALGFILGSMTNSAFAECLDIITLYSRESDDVGTRIPLAYSCNNSVGDYLCVYLNAEGTRAGVKGEIERTYFQSSELYNRSLNNSQAFLSLEHSNGISVDMRKVILKLDKLSGKAAVTYKNKGWSPFDGIINISKSADFYCK